MTDSELLDVVLVQLRHGYVQLRDGRVSDYRAFAENVIAPQIRRLEDLQGRIALAESEQCE